LGCAGDAAAMDMARPAGRPARRRLGARQAKIHPFKISGDALGLALCLDNRRSEGCRAIKRKAFSGGSIFLRRVVTRWARLDSEIRSRRGKSRTPVRYWRIEGELAHKDKEESSRRISYRHWARSFLKYPSGGIAGAGVTG
jgi:hypothetical protein